ncbi:MAG: hypothetical protein NT094_04045 [Candidatus Staskawiczbacteria bacterium]|nr:hypothetical protein [Candidatus Staskawiczbacteria bacterium]
MSKIIERQSVLSEDKSPESELLKQDGGRPDIKESIEEIEGFILDIKERETREKVRKLLEELNLDSQSLATIIEEAKDNQECSCADRIEGQLKALMQRNSSDDLDKMIGEKVPAT